MIKQEYKTIATPHPKYKLEKKSVIEKKAFIRKNFLIIQTVQVLRGRCRHGNPLSP
jgi:hypothetical protein